MILGIYGSGGSGRELLHMIKRHEILVSAWEKIVFIDDTKPNGVFKNVEVIHFDDFCKKYKPDIAKIVIAVGEPKYRYELSNKALQKGYLFATILSPLADISDDAVIEDGVVVKDYAMVSSDTQIGFNTWIQSHSIVGHDAHIGKNCQISSFATIAGRTIVEDNVFVGIGACIREDMVIGEFAIISMGAVVLKNVGKNKIAMGNPAREIAENINMEVFKNR